MTLKIRIPTENQHVSMCFVHLYTGLCALYQFIPLKSGDLKSLLQVLYNDNTSLKEYIKQKVVLFCLVKRHLDIMFLEENLNV